MRYFLELRYNGAAYCGWQRQPDMPLGAADARAGARYPVARENRGDRRGAYRHGCATPPITWRISTVAAPAARSGADGLQTQFPAAGRHRRGKHDARRRTVRTPVSQRGEREYRYYIEPRKNPFTRGTTWQYYVPLDVGADERGGGMAAGATTILRRSPSSIRTTRPTSAASCTPSWTADGQGVLCFTIRADRFLRNMVRSLVGTLVDVGRGRYTPAAVPRDRREPRPVALERRRPCAGAFPERCGLSGRTCFERKVCYTDFNK